MVILADVTQFISENVLHSKLYDSATPEMKQKAVNQSANTLVKYMSDVYKDVEALPVDDVAEQVLWLLKMDDSMQRAEMGTMMISVDGTQIMLKDMDRTIAPKLLSLHGITSIRKRRVGQYSTGSNYRYGQQTPDRRY